MTGTVIIYVQITFDEVLKAMDEAEAKREKMKKNRELRSAKMKEFKVTAREESIDCHGLNFLCIYGNHINGGYVALANWGVFAELSNHIHDDRYNKDKILSALENSTFKNWLPYDEDERAALARDLAKMIGKRIRAMREQD